LPGHQQAGSDHRYSTASLSTKPTVFTSTLPVAVQIRQRS